MNSDTRRWIAPPAGYTKVNVDAAVAKYEAKGAVGAVCRSAEGLFLGGSVIVYNGITHPGTLEALACREAIDVADDLALGGIVVASDCLEVLKGLHTDHLGVFGSILMEIRVRARLRGATLFIHESRVYNGEPHRLARFASSLPVGRHVWLGVPPNDVNIHVNIVPV